MVLWRGLTSSARVVIRSDKYSLCTRQRPLPPGYLKQNNASYTSNSRSGIKQVDQHFLVARETKCSYLNRRAFGSPYS